MVLIEGLGCAPTPVVKVPGVFIARGHLPALVLNQTLIRLLHHDKLALVPMIVVRMTCSTRSAGYRSGVVTDLCHDFAPVCLRIQPLDIASVWYLIYSLQQYCAKPIFFMFIPELLPHSLEIITAH